MENIRKKGYTTAFRTGGEFSRFSFSMHTESLLNQFCIDVLMHYKTILEGNHCYVNENIDRIENLYNSHFLNDLRSLFRMSWEIKARSLASDIHSNLIKSLPYMTSIVNIPFQFHAEIVK
jgi:predicted phosphohydrolase